MNDSDLPGPPRIQIQTQAGCNGRCVFCPNEEILRSGLPHGKMNVTLFRKIIDELALTNPRRISLYLQNEPVNDKRLPELVRYVADRVPHAATLVTSNGTKLTEAVTEALIRAGLQRLKISLQSLDPETNRRIMGYSSERVIENVLGAKKVADRLGANHFDLRVSMVVTNINAEEIARARRFWRKHGVRLVTSALENRGGNIEDADGMNLGGMRRRRDCIRPYREMCVLYNGDVILCCVDWHRTVVLGNLENQSIREVWNGPRLAEIRRAFKNGDENNLPEICMNCTESACPDSHRRSLKTFLKRFITPVSSPRRR